MNINWIQIASLLMFLAVALGAFGAHALRAKLTEHYFDVYRTAVLYHLIHALALFVVAWVNTQTNDPKVQAAGIFILAGIVLFSGSLYILAITQIKWLGAITPLGGLSFLAGWLILFLAKYNG